MDCNVRVRRSKGQSARTLASTTRALQRVATGLLVTVDASFRENAGVPAAWEGRETRQRVRHQELLRTQSQNHAKCTRSYGNTGSL